MTIQRSLAFELDLAPGTLPYLDDHRVDGHVVFPAAAFLEMIVAAGGELLGAAAIDIEDAQFLHTLVIGEGRAVTVALERTADDRADVRIESRAIAGGAPTLHVTAAVCANSRAPAPDASDVRARREVLAPISVDAFYARVRAGGLAFGPSFRGVRALRVGRDEAIAEVALPAELADDADAYHLHPALLDACFQAGFAIAMGDDAAPILLLPVRVGRMRLAAAPCRPVTSHVCLRAEADAPGVIAGDVRLYDDAGALVGWLDDVRLARVSMASRLALAAGSWHHEVAWEPIMLDGLDGLDGLGAATAADAPRWRIVADRGGVADAVCAALVARGADATVIAPGAAITSAPEDGVHVVHLAGLDAPALDASTPADVIALTTTAYATASTLLAGLVAPSRLSIVTRGAVDTGAHERVVPLAAPLWGIGRTMSLEAPDRFGRLIDLDPDAPPDAAAIVAALLAGGADDQLAVRGVRVVVPRVIATRRALGERIAIRADAAYLITGGLGAIGLGVAHALVAEGARHLVLVSRRGSAAGDAIAALRARGVTVTIVACDVGDPDAVAALFAQIDALGVPLAGIVHAAGTADQVAAIALSPARLAPVLHAKLAGALLLHRATRDRALEFFTCVSSISGVWGAQGLAHYAGANAFLDAFAAERRRAGLAAQSIAWGPWAGDGMAGATVAELRKIGLCALDPAIAAPLLVALVRDGRGAEVVVDADWDRLTQVLEIRRARPMLARLGASAIATAEAEGVSTAADAADAADPAHVHDALCALVATALGIPAASLDPDAPLNTLGLDSLAAVSVQDAVRQRYGVKLPMAMLITGSTVGALAAHVSAALGARAPAAAATSAPTEIAIVADPAQRHEPFPLSPLQEALWVGRLGDFSIGNVTCHVYVELERADTAIDLDRLERAIDRVVARHDMLRATIDANGQQRVLAERPPYRIARVDLRGQSAADVARALADVRARMSHQLRSAARWPLFDVHATILDGRVRIHWSQDTIIADIFSLRIMLRDLTRAYAEPALALPAPALTFRDFVLAERAFRDSDRYRQARAYWLDRVPTMPLAPELPLKKPLAEIAKPTFVRHQATLPAAAWRRLQDRAAQSGLTPSGVVCAAYLEILGCWSRQPACSIVLTFFNRPPVHPAINEAVGDFVSSVILSRDGDGDTFDARAQRLQHQLWADLEHRHFGGVPVLREISRTRGGALIPVVFTSALPQDRQGKDAIEPLSARWFDDVVHTITQTPQVILDHQVFELDDAVVLIWECVDDVFPTGMIDDMFASYTALLAQLADDPAAWHAPALDLLPPHQQATIAAANATDRELADELIHEPFLAQAARAPDRPALIAHDRTWSYGELAARVRQVAHRVRALGARPDHPVPIVMAKGAEQVIAALGITLAGAPYLPIDVEAPAERIAYMLARAGAAFVLTQAELAARLAWPAGLGVHILDDDWLAGVPTDELARAATPRSLANVIFTSGSTGHPKGVMLEHRGLANGLADTNRRFAIGPDDRVLALTALHHDMSVFDTFGVLAAGGAIVMPRAARWRDPAEWSALMQAHGVTLWNSVPAFMAMMLEHARAHPGAIPRGLRWAFLGGDFIPLSAPDELRAHAASARVVSVGGPTETSLWNIWYVVDAVDPAWRSIPYGKPIANTRYHVLDARLATRPLWAPGEMYVDGVGVARGYLGDDAQTRERFVVHPRTGARLYRTGDLGRVLPDGNLEILGREDFQVKLRGHRVELAEVEAALAAAPGVRHAAAVAVGARGDQRLVAFVVGDARLDPAHVRAAVGATLPPYMVPDVRVIAALPLTTNGKVDRRALAASAASAAEVASVETNATISPTASIVARVTAVVADILGAPELAADVDLFTLGATSVDFIRIANSLEAMFGSRPAIEQFFATPSVAAIARFYETAAPPPAPTKMTTEPLVALARRVLPSDGPRIALPGRTWPRASVAPAFSLQPVALATLAALLARLGDRADGLDLYVHVARGRIAGLAPGNYVHDAHAHALVPIGDARLPPELADAHAAFALIAIADLAAYGAGATTVAALDAGRLARAAEQLAAEHALAIVPRALAHPTALAEPLALSRGQVALVALAGGHPFESTSAPRAAGPLATIEAMLERVEQLTDADAATLAASLDE